MKEYLHLRPYQEGMRAFAHGQDNTGIFAGMGIGKTAVGATVMLDTIYDTMQVDRWLVVGPNLVAKDVWPRTFDRWAQFRHLDYRVLTAEDFELRVKRDEATGRRMGLHHGGRDDKRSTKKRLQAMRESVHIVPWHLLHFLVKTYGVNWPYGGLMLDESIFAANTTSEQHKSVYHVVHRLQAVQKLVLLSGSPMPNGYEQLHGQVRLLDPELLGDSKTEFRNRYMQPATMNRHTGQVYDWKLSRGAKEEVDELVRGVAISLKTEDYVQLPPCTVNSIRVTLPEAARATYAALERDLLVEVGDSTVLAPSAAVLVGKLMQLANGAIYTAAGVWAPVHDEKIEQLRELMDTIEGPILLAYSYEHDWLRIHNLFSSKHVDHVKHPRALDRFRAGKTKVLCMHPASGAHGLDGLQDVSSEAVWFGATYNADHWGQFNKRLHRDGQRAGRVTIHQIIAADTIEEYVAGRVIPDKVMEQELFLEAVRSRMVSHVH